MRIRHRQSETGFTLMEIMVATSVFVVVLTMMLTLFSYTIRINRRVEALRQVTQSTRNFTEFLVREIRNGTIDYTGTIDDKNCPSASPQYDPTANQTLALVNRNGDRECFYLDGEALRVTRIAVNGQTVSEQVTPPNVKIERDTFRFHVRPVSDPRATVDGEYSGTQPFVAILMSLSIRINPTDPVLVLPYQTTVSTDTYDIPHR